MLNNVLAPISSPIVLIATIDSNEPIFLRRAFANGYAPQSLQDLAPLQSLAVSGAIAFDRQDDGK
jgi:hypothetical protein